MPAAVPPAVRKRYYATFIPGTQELIAETVQQRLKDVAILRLLDGAVLFETALDYDRLNFFCFNNIFAVADVMEHRSPQGALEAHAGAMTRGNRMTPNAMEIIAHNTGKFRTFRIVFARENTPAAIDASLRITAEKYIAGISGLKPDRAAPDAEFWFLYRSEGFSVFMKRLTLRPSWEKSLHPGELPPPLAWMLCRLGKLQAGDTVLDPFCGYGSIPRAALKQFHITHCIACDSNAQAAAYTLKQFKKRPANFTLHTADFRSLPALMPPHSVNAIVTDPPWGQYRENPAGLYRDMFKMFDKVLAENGRLVILGGRDFAPNEDAKLPDAAGGRFALQKSVPILLSGKKAGIYVYKNKA